MHENKPLASEMQLNTSERGGKPLVLSSRLFAAAQLVRYAAGLSVGTGLECYLLAFSIKLP
jgi:hypothetical protein